jgi:hypothetical protein
VVLSSLIIVGFCARSHTRNKAMRPRFGGTDYVTLGRVMTDEYSPSTARQDAEGTPETVKEQASQVGHEVAGSAKNVAGAAKDEAAKVAGETKKQAKALYEESRSQLTDQAGAQQQRVAAGLRDIGDELTRMADSSDQPGVASDVVSQVAARTSAAAAWLDDRDPGSLLREVKNFARSKPGTFIAVSALAGLVAGRVVRSLASEAHDENSDASAPSAPAAATSAPAEYSPPASPSVLPTQQATTPVYNATVNEGRSL